jgi:Uma2 family endonuclease
MNIAVAEAVAEQTEGERMYLMPLVLPDFVSPVRISLDRPLSDEELVRLCESNEVFHVEREPNGRLLVRKIGGLLAGCVSATLSGHLWEWAEQDGRGKAFNNAGFILKDGSMRGPRLAWVSSEKLKAVDPKRRKGFPPVCPEFVIEILSCSYTLSELREKMQAWIANGVELAWLVDPMRKVVEVYRPDRETETLEDKSTVEGAGPVLGLVVGFGRIWDER